jgi:hypothetical protein
VASEPVTVSNTDTARTRRLVAAVGLGASSSFGGRCAWISAAQEMLEMLHLFDLVTGRGLLLFVMSGQKRLVELKVSDIRLMFGHGLEYPVWYIHGRYFRSDMSCGADWGHDRADGLDLNASKTT